MAASCDKPQKPEGNVRMMNPKDLLFSQASLCDPIPSTEPGTPPAAYKALHEDDWRQIEFVPVVNRDYLQAKLTEFITFREQHRSGSGFTKIFLRPEHPITFYSIGFHASQLPRFTQFAAVLGSVPIPNGLGRGIVPGGFALSDGGDWFLYGQCAPDFTLIALAISPGDAAAPSEPFVRALVELAGTRFILVDWYLGAVVDTSSPESVLAWARRFQ